MKESMVYFEEWAPIWWVSSLSLATHTLTGLSRQELFS